MENLPSYVYIVFILTTMLTVYFYYEATSRSTAVLLILIAWLAMQGIVGYTGYYQQTSGTPPRFVLLVLPPLLAIILLFTTLKGKRYIESLNEKTLTLLHVVRIPVELVLYWLFIYKAVPELMTFDGRNFDIFSGITAPFIWYFGYKRKMLSPKLILLWNFICLLLLFNIVIHGILSAPFPFQQLAFNQPNIGLMYFPYIWLPCFIVPLVLFAHLVCIRKLLNDTHMAGTDQRKS